MFLEQLVEPVLPAGVGRDDIQENMQHCGLRTEGHVGRHVRFVLLGHLGRDGKAAVPQSGVVGAEVSQVGNGVQPGVKRPWRQRERRADRLPVAALLQVGVDDGQGADGQDLGDHPTRWKLGGVVLLEVMLNKRLALLVLNRAVLGVMSGLRPYLVQQLVVPILLAEQRLVQVPVRPIALGHRVGDCDPGGDLDALDGIHDQKPQLPVEDVQIQDSIERDTVAEGVGGQGGIVALEGQGIAAQAVVADEPQVVERLSPDRDLEAPLDQAVGLLSRVSAGLSNLVFLCFSGIKNPPWCADLTRGVAGVVI